MRIPLYEMLKVKVCTPEEMNAVPLYKKMIIGILSGSIGIAFATPAEVIKVKM